MARSLVRLVPALGLALALVLGSTGCGTDNGNGDPDGGPTGDRQTGRDSTGGNDRVVRPDRPASDLGGTDTATDSALDTAGEDTAPDGTPPVDLPPFYGPSGDSGVGTACAPETSTCGTGLR